MHFLIGVYLFAGIFIYASFVLGHGAECRLVQLCALCIAANYNPGPNIDFYALGIDFSRHLDDGRRDEFCRDVAAHAGARHVDQPAADPDLGHPDRVAPQISCWPYPP